MHTFTALEVEGFADLLATGFTGTALDGSST